MSRRKLAAAEACQERIASNDTTKPLFHVGMVSQHEKDKMFQGCDTYKPSADDVQHILTDRFKGSFHHALKPEDIHHIRPGFQDLAALRRRQTLASCFLAILQSVRPVTTSSASTRDAS